MICHPMLLVVNFERTIVSKSLSDFMPYGTHNLFFLRIISELTSLLVFTSFFVWVMTRHRFGSTDECLHP